MPEKLSCHNGTLAIFGFEQLDTFLTGNLKMEEVPDSKGVSNGLRVARVRGSEESHRLEHYLGVEHLMLGQ
jgi:hypothetical protein